jgi:hypothetical protein
MILFETGPMYSANLSASSEENACLTNQTSFTSITSPYYFEHSGSSEMRQDFSDVTIEEIRMKCRRRCVICGRPLGEKLGNCAHILDSAEEGAKMVSQFSQQTGDLTSHPYVDNICNQHWGSRTILQPVIGCERPPL